MSTKPYIEVDADGRIVSSGLWPKVIPFPNTKGTMFYVVEGDPPKPDTAYWDGKAVVPLVSRPTEHHDFDYKSREWQLNTGKAWAAVRARRDELLAQSDWVALRAADTGGAAPKQWRTYRQLLRDVTNHPDPLNIIWPEIPAG